MSYIIAITGKGGVGKTTVSAVMISRMIARGCRPILAIDADPNTNLDAALGIRIEKTIGGIREEAKQYANMGMAAGIDKKRLLDMKIAESLVECSDFDLIAMGRSEGAGCYCYANNILKDAIQQMASYYPYVLLDNEAGLENLSRRIVQAVDLMIMVSDPSVRGMDTVRRLHGLTEEMGIAYRWLAVVVNRLRRNELPAHAKTLIDSMNAGYVVVLPDDETIVERSEEGISLAGLASDNPVVAKIDGLLDQLGLTGSGR
jgi:CO dehydrogenase maturation factor